MIEKLVSFFSGTRHGPLGTAVAVGLSSFGGIFIFLQAMGIKGEPVVFLSIALASSTLAWLVHGFLLRQRIKALQVRKEEATDSEINDLMGDVLSALPVDSPEARSVQKLRDRYEERIRQLQIRLRASDFPGEAVWVEGGALIAASTETAAGAVDTFRIDQYPVTNQEFSAFIRKSPEWRADAIYNRFGIPYYLCEFRNMDPPEDKWDHPVVWVNWFAAVAFCNWRSCKDGKQPVYTFVSSSDVVSDLNNDGWRLPTELEWEMAARAGLSDAHPWEKGLDPTKANYGNHYRGSTSVGRFPANGLGICDMLGNVKEWCHDSFRDPPNVEIQDASNPPAPAGNFKVFRGASWMEPKEQMFFGRRGKLPPQNTNPDFGFRCVCRPRRAGGTLAVRTGRAQRE